MNWGAISAISEIVVAAMMTPGIVRKMRD